MTNYYILSDEQARSPKWSLFSLYNKKTEEVAEIVLLKNSSVSHVLDSMCLSPGFIFTELKEAENKFKILKEKHVDRQFRLVSVETLTKEISV